MYQNWTVLFVGCIDVEDYTAKVMSALNTTTASSIYETPEYKRRRFIQHIMQLLRGKQREWEATRRIGYLSALKSGGHGGHLLQN